MQGAPSPVEGRHDQHQPGGQGHGDVEHDGHQERLEIVQALAGPRPDFHVEHPHSRRSALVAKELKQRKIAVKIVAKSLSKNSALVEFVKITLIKVGESS